jgi:hypothetical protein
MFGLQLARARGGASDESPHDARDDTQAACSDDCYFKIEAHAQDLLHGLLLVGLTFNLDGA